MTQRRYTGKDFDTLVQEVKSRLQRNYPEYTFDFNNDPQRLLVEILAYAVRGMNFYTDVQANELWLESAELRTQIDRRAAERGYNPKGAASASGDLRVRPAEAVGKIVRMPKKFQWEGANGFVYETTHEVVWQPDSRAYKTVTISQGETRRMTFRSNGERFQRYDLSAVENPELVAWRSPTVTVSGEEWSETDDMLDTDERVYRVGYTADPPYIEFGDGAVGDIPPSGAEIAVEFRATRGRDGEIRTSRISGPADDVLVSGGTVDLEFEPSTERIAGASNRESKRSIKNNAPHADHSDGAVVTGPDFDALVENYQHQLYGKVAAARAVLATGIEKDMVAFGLIRSIRSAFVDSDDLLSQAGSDIRAHLDSLSSSKSDLDGHLSTAVTEIENGGTLDGILNTIDGIRQTAYDRTYEIRGKSDEISVASSDVNSEASTIDSTLSNISTGSSDELTQSTKDKIQSSVDIILSRSKSSGAIEKAASAIASSAGNLQSDMDGLDSEVGKASKSRKKADGALSDAQTSSSEIGASETDAEDRYDQLESDLENPWDKAVIGAGGTKSDLDKLESHLDGVFADVGGPNLITVPILSYDSDGFYVSPSVGLMRNVEQYIRNRNEPSVVFSVTDGSEWLVDVDIEVSFQPKTGNSPQSIKSALETQLLGVVRDRGFGEDLPLDDLYDAAREVRDRTVMVNIEIVAFDGGPRSDTSIDADGNLIVPEREVMTRPDLTFYRRFEDGTKKAV